ncbi:HpcH/HpaI aldolase family protein [Roseobacter sp. HKCCA0434]|uniref:HpcH/HpaI aldolase family protein n=1 Tax=Roseobacter sp. HKCCA0434 TaxID=3079297 RepID=UPI002905D2F1|nr:aldolase/citrate lyase family protein [Roseobacter sp. HKCCA0434]
MDTRLGCWLDIPSPHVAEIVGQTGFDWALIDCEHGPIGIETASVMMMALRGTRTMLRVPDLDEGWIKRALDTGAQSVMVPNIKSAEEAAAAVRFFHYAPAGSRGEAQSVIRAARWGRDAAAYAADWPGAHELIVQIETPQALAEVDAIAATPGVDMLFLGPADFAASSGLSKDAPEVLDAAREIARAATAAGKRSGSVLFPAGNVEALVELGMTDISIASDVAVLAGALDSTLAAVNR